MEYFFVMESRSLSQSIMFQKCAFQIFSSQCLQNFYVTCYHKKKDSLLLISHHLVLQLNCVCVLTRLLPINFLCVLI